LKVERIIRLLEQVVDPTEKRKLVSFVDHDARFGRKSKDKKFAGYKAHVAQDESQIITSAEVIPGNENEGNECSLNKDRARIYVSDSHLLYIKADPEEKRKALKKR